jgi:crotonobetainyl-CoA:carnitine CoA-transferase CaiB-like acyl-CoA transferase
MVLNRGKKSVMLDDSSREVGKLVAKLAGTADAILIDAPGLVAKNLGLDARALTRKYPDKVIVDITAFSCNCKMKDELADDMILQAITGLASSLMNINGDPVCASTMIFDKVTGFLASGAVVAGLYSKLQSGMGQRANVSKYDAAMHFNWADGFMNSTWKDTIKPGGGRVPKFPPLSAVYKLADSCDRKACMTVIAVGDAEFRGLLEATDSLDILEKKPHWKTLAGRLGDMADLAVCCEAVTKKIGRDELERRCQENGVPCALVLTIEELMRHPQALASEIFQSCSHPELGAYTLPRHAARFIGTPATSAGQPAPLPGQHSSEVLLRAGLSGEEVAAHVASGAVRDAGPIERLEVRWMSGAALWGRAKMKVAPVLAFRDVAKKQKRGFNKSSRETFDPTIQQLIRQESGAVVQCVCEDGPSASTWTAQCIDPRSLRGGA